MKRGAYRRQKIGVHIKDDTTPVQIDYDELWRLQIKYKLQDLSYKMEKLKEERRELEQQIRVWRRANDQRDKEVCEGYREVLDPTTAESEDVGRDR